MAKKKSFFAERTPAQIKKLKREKTQRQKGIVERIAGLDPTEEALEIRAQLIPGRFFLYGRTPMQASRKFLKESYEALRHPQTKTECDESPIIPLQLRAQLMRTWEQLQEDQINSVGYFVRPNWGDRTKRVSPLAFMAEGIRLFAYAENLAGGVPVIAYKDARRVPHEGADVVVNVPSRTKKEPRYEFRLQHVPIIRSPENLSTVLTMKPALAQNEITDEPKNGRTRHETHFARYTFERDPESSKMIVTYPHDVAGYVGIIKSEWMDNKNLTSLEMNPYTLFSKRGADFYKRLCNNVLIYDGSLRSKDKLRKPHLSEKSLLLARAIGTFGHDEIAFWDPGRDGKLKEYNWSIPGKE